MKCFEVKLTDVNGNIYVQRLCCVNTMPSHIFHAAWKSLYEGKHVAATALIDTLKEIEAI